MISLTCLTFSKLEKHLAANLTEQHDDALVLPVQVTTLIEPLSSTHSAVYTACFDDVVCL